MTIEYKLIPGLDIPFEGEPYYDWCPNCGRMRDFTERAWYENKCCECYDEEPRNAELDYYTSK